MRGLLAAALPLAVLALDAPRTPRTLVPPPASPTDAAGVAFSEVARAAGLAAFHRVSGSPAKEYILEAKGGGVALFDADGDGSLDVYLLNGASFAFLRGQQEAPAAALFRNYRDGTFTDVTASACVANRGWGQGACTGDFDNDGDDDLYVTNFGKNRLYRNDGRGHFEDVAGAAGVSVGGWSTGCAFADYDGDGRLDLFVAGDVALDVGLLPPAPPGAVARPDAAAATESNTPGRQAPYRPGLPYVASPN